MSFRDIMNGPSVEISKDVVRLLAVTKTYLDSEALPIPVSLN